MSVVSTIRIPNTVNFSATIVVSFSTVKLSATIIVSFSAAFHSLSTAALDISSTFQIPAMRVTGPLPVIGDVQIAVWLATTTVVKVATMMFSTMFSTMVYIPTTVIGITSAVIAICIPTMGIAARPLPLSTTVSSVATVRATVRATMMVIPV